MFADHEFQIPERVATELAIGTTNVSIMKVLIGLIGLAGPGADQIELRTSALAKLLCIKSGTVASAASSLAQIPLTLVDFQAEPLPITLISELHVAGPKIVGRWSDDFLELKSCASLRLDPTELGRYATRAGFLIALRAAGLTARSTSFSVRVRPHQIGFLVGSVARMSPAQVWAAAIEPGLREHQRLSWAHEARLIPLRTSTGRIRRYEFHIERLYRNGVQPGNLLPEKQKTASDQIVCNQIEPATAREAPLEPQRRKGSWLPLAPPPAPPGSRFTFVRQGEAPSISLQEFIDVWPQILSDPRFIEARWTVPRQPDGTFSGAGPTDQADRVSGRLLIGDDDIGPRRSDADVDHFDRLRGVDS